MDYLARREHSQSELKRKLASRADNKDLLEAVLADLVSEGLQSDSRFVEAYVRSKMNAGIGPIKLRMELIQKGISDACLESALDIDEEIWLEQCRAVWEKKYRGQKATSRNEQAKQIRFLMSRGFGMDLIKRVIEPER